jgi:hypothetical protein
MRVMIRFTAREELNALPILLRHSPGAILPNLTYVVTTEAAQALRDGGVRFTELTNESDIPWDIDKETVQTLPPQLRQAVRELEAQIDQLDAQKETAIDACDFERAARLRVQTDSLKKRRQELIWERLK